MIKAQVYLSAIRVDFYIQLHTINLMIYYKLMAQVFSCNTTSMQGSKELQATLKIHLSWLYMVIKIRRNRHTLGLKPLVKKQVNFK